MFKKLASDVRPNVGAGLKSGDFTSPGQGGSSRHNECEEDKMARQLGTRQPFNKNGLEQMRN
jgi:hypothetical protein